MCIYTSIKCHTFFCVRKTVAFYPGFPAQFSTFADSEAQHYIHSTAFKCRTFSFDFSPQILWVSSIRYIEGYYSSDLSGKVPLSKSFICFRGCNQIDHNYYMNGGYSMSINLVWGNKSVAYYSQDASKQYNTGNTTYYYCAIG